MRAIYERFFVVLYQKKRRETNLKEWCLRNSPSAYISIAINVNVEIGTSIKAESPSTWNVKLWYFCPIKKKQLQALICRFIQTIGFCGKCRSPFCHAASSWFAVPWLLDGVWLKQISKKEKHHSPQTALARRAYKSTQIDLLQLSRER